MVKQEEIQETFIRNIFTKKRCLNEVGVSLKFTYYVIVEEFTIQDAKEERWSPSK